MESNAMCEYASSKGNGAKGVPVPHQRVLRRLDNKLHALRTTGLQYALMPKSSLHPYYQSY